jgi:hypothetical protein
MTGETPAAAIAGSERTGAVIDGGKMADISGI